MENKRHQQEALPGSRREESGMNCTEAFFDCCNSRVTLLATDLCMLMFVMNSKDDLIGQRCKKIFFGLAGSKMSDDGTQHYHCGSCRYGKTVFV